MNQQVKPPAGWTEIEPEFDHQQQTFQRRRDGLVVSIEQESHAAYNVVTLPENYHQDDQVIDCIEIGVKPEDAAETAHEWMEQNNRDASQKLLEKFKQTFDAKRADNLTPEGWQSADETIMIFPKGVEKVGFVRTDNFSPVGYVGEDEIVTNSKTFKTYTFSRNETTHHLHRQRVDKVLTVLGVDETYLLENTLSRWDLGDDHSVVIDTETDYYIIVAPVIINS